MISDSKKKHRGRTAINYINPIPNPSCCTCTESASQKPQGRGESSQHQFYRIQHQVHSGELHCQASPCLSLDLTHTSWAHPVGPTCQNHFSRLHQQVSCQELRTKILCIAPLVSFWFIPSLFFIICFLYQSWGFTVVFLDPSIIHLTCYLGDFQFLDIDTNYNELSSQQCFEQMPHIFICSVHDFIDFKHFFIFSLTSSITHYTFVACCTLSKYLHIFWYNLTY